MKIGKGKKRNEIVSVEVDFSRDIVYTSGTLAIPTKNAIVFSSDLAKYIAAQSNDNWSYVRIFPYIAEYVKWHGEVYRVGTVEKLETLANIIITEFAIMQLK